MRKPPYKHPVTGHYREGKYVDRYTRGKGAKTSEGHSIKRMGGSDTGFKVTLYYGDGKDTQTVKAANYTEAVTDGFTQAEVPEMPRRVRVRRLK